MGPVTSVAAVAKPKSCPSCGGTFDSDAVFCPRDGTKLIPESAPLPPPDDPNLGTIVGGDIELVAVAGAGAMGRVYRGHQKGIDRDVAVKILHRELSGNTQLVGRFHREAKIASRLQHPNVVDVYFTGQLPDGSLFIVMEYLDGQSLASALTAIGGRFSLARALAIALQIGDAVGEGHARGIVHRDLKPENVMLVKRAEQNDWVKVLDFGIARVSLGEQSMETAAGLIFGTARYISPEGAQGAVVGPPGDVYALATMLYQMLAGRTPFEADKPVALLVKHIHEVPPDLASLPGGGEIPAPIVRVVMQNLAKDPAARAPNARAFSQQLAAAAREANVSFSDVGVLPKLLAQDAASARGPALEPTMDDRGASAPPAPLAIPPAPVAVVRAPAMLESASPARAPSERPTKESHRRANTLIILLAFLLGSALTVIVTQHLANRGDTGRAKTVAKARVALIESRYVSPPGDNVRDLVAEGMKEWPNDPELAQLRSDAAHEMVTRSMAARAGGDVQGARDLVRDATTLDETDHSARMLLAQYDDDLRALESGAMTTGGPKVFFDVPAVAHPTEAVVMTARVLPGTAGPKAKISDVTITVYPNGRTKGGQTVSLSSSDPSRIRAQLNAPAVGSYDVVFEAAVDGRPVRAERDLNVVK